MTTDLPLFIQDIVLAGNELAANIMYGFRPFLLEKPSLESERRNDRFARPILHWCTTTMGEHRLNSVRDILNNPISQKTVAPQSFHDIQQAAEDVETQVRTSAYITLSSIGYLQHKFDQSLHELCQRNKVLPEFQRKAPLFKGMIITYTKAAMLFTEKFDKHPRGYKVFHSPERIAKLANQAITDALRS
jgi:hypothetical protein